MTLVAMVDGLAGAGLDVSSLRRDLALDAAPPAAATRPASDLDLLIERAGALDPRPTLAMEVGLNVPMGGFGIVDYLANSSETIRSSLLSLEAHFAALASVLRIELDATPEELVVRVVDIDNASDWGMEFSLGAIFGRFRDHVAIREAGMRRPEPDPAFAAVLGVPVRFAASCSFFSIPNEALDLASRRADPRLYAALLPVASELVAGRDRGSIETAVRARLRDLLPTGRADAAAVARLLGVSERTLSRRLSDAGTTFRDVMDGFCAEESERLLRRELSLSEIAERLGYGDQSAWTKAFRRWRGVTPAAWRRADRADRPGP